MPLTSFLAPPAFAAPPLIVRRRSVCDWEAGPREMAEMPLPRAARPLLERLSSPMCVATADRVAAITYDDGPDPVQTPLLLDELSARGASATFFLLVRQAMAHPQIVSRIAAEGHEVGLHGIDHTRLSTLSLREAAARIRDGKRELEAIAGAPVRLFRPAYGAQRLGQLLLARRLGLTSVIWSAWAQDWLDGDAAALGDRAAAAIHPGAILLLHDAIGDAETVTAPVPSFSRRELTARLLTRLDEKGYTTLTVGDLLARYQPLHTLWFERRQRTST